MNAKPGGLSMTDAEWRIVYSLLQRRVPGHTVWAFGSRAVGAARRFSDLDIAIVSDAPLDLDTRAALAEDFAESDLPYKVDIVQWAELSPRFREIVQREHIVLSS